MTARRLRPDDRSALPLSLRAAAGLLVLYGVAVVLNATVMYGAAQWMTSRELPSAIVRLAGTVLVAWGLLRRLRWAWWLGLVLTTFWLVTGAAAVLVLQRGDVHWLQPSRLQILLVVSLLALGLSLALLLSPSARAVFRGRRP